MSYLSLISWTDRDVIWVATRIRSAYSSVSKRETSFSRIALDSVMAINSSPIRFSILILADREKRALFGDVFRLHDRPKFRLRDPGRPVPGDAEELRVRLLPVQNHGTVDAIQVEHDPGEVLQLGRGGALGGDEPDEHVFRPPDRREDARHLLEDLLLVHRLERVERHEREERTFRFRELELHVRPLQVRVDVRAFHVKDGPRDVRGAEGRRLEDAHLRVERARRQVGTDQLAEELGAPLSWRDVGDAAPLGGEVADDGGPQPVDVVRRHGVGNLERDDAAAVEPAGQAVERLEPEAHGVLREVLHGPPQLRLHRSNFLADVERGEAASVKRVQVPMLLDLLAAELLDRQDAKPAALMVRRREADDPVAEVVETGLAAAFEDVQDVLLAPFHEVFLEDGDEPPRGDAVVLREGVDRVDEDERALRDTVVDEGVRVLELRQVEAEGDLQEVSFDLPGPDRLRILVFALLAFLELPLELVEGMPRDLRVVRSLRARLEDFRLDPVLQPGELAVQRLVRDAGAEIVGGRDLAERFGQLQGERRLPSAGRGLHDEAVPTGRVEELDDLSRNTTGGGRHGTASKQRGRIYIGFPGGVSHEQTSSRRSLAPTVRTQGASQLPRPPVGRAGPLP